MRSIKALAEKLSQIDWQWDQLWWEHVAQDLALRKKEAIAGRLTYADTDGELWDVYLKGGEIIFVEINFDVFDDIESLSDSDYEDKIDEYFKKFEVCVDDLAPVLGKPKFADGAAARGFPEDQEANWLALWEGKNSRLMLQQKHESRDFPLRLCIVVAPIAL
ncbi:hypothetical protein P3W85_28420 [Cupriavidus basilensis]|uniref:Uncharacterized protein n=1 Tax=Cupriavidus basilensis TaxID=68895 RepID=A0ABT6AW59_9BURK|nr:hypothetical protein [Cupriavidus basilensis]MDF3836845.1 hypothetical protein [Cupriavidus basilensis]